MTVAQPVEWNVVVAVVVTGQCMQAILGLA
jgi:hypothetical protein